MTGFGWRRRRRARASAKRALDLIAALVQAAFTGLIEAQEAVI
jgi:hypothetical protein